MFRAIAKRAVAAARLQASQGAPNPSIKSLAAGPGKLVGRQDGFSSKALSTLTLDTKGAGSPRITAECLSAKDAGDVRTFYQNLDSDTLAAAHGSYCAMTWGPVADGRSSALKDLQKSYDNALKDGHVPVGLRAATGEIVGICFYTRPDSKGESHSYGLTIATDCQHQGLAQRLKTEQFAVARKNGVQVLVTDLDFTQSKGLMGTDPMSVADIAKESSVVARVLRASQVAGLQADVELRDTTWGGVVPTGARTACVAVHLNVSAATTETA